MMDLKFNKYQSSLEELNINQYPEEVQEQFYDFVNNVPYIKNLVSPNRRTSKDMPKDDQGKIIVDLENPHIIEDMDYFRPTALHFQKTGRMTDLRPNANPNSEFGKWIREEIRRCWYGYVREDDGEWVSGDMYYYLNYCPIQQIEGDAVRVRRIIDMPRIWEGQYLVTHYLNKARESGMFAAELASRGKGKALPLTNFVPTPNGWKFWGDIQVGDLLWDEKGNPTKVIDIPYYGPIDVLRIGLSDGREIFCSAEHEFEITYYQTKQIRDADWIGRNYHKTRNKGPKNPTGDEYVITLPIGDCVQFKEKQVPIDAYTLGLMLGDGCFRTPSNKHSVRFTGDVNDVDFYKTQVPYKIYRHPKHNTENSIKKSDIVKELKELELWGKNSHNKFIPEIYKYNSENIRLSLLQGLVDTDGWINGRTQCYCTTSETMKDDVLEVARSLGIKSYSFKKKDAWTISFQTDRILCRLPRKVSKIKKLTQRYIKTSKRVTVINVSYVTRCIGKCVTVSNESGLFLANDYIVTHNSYLGAALLAKRFNLGEDELVDEKVQSVVTASLEKYIHGANQILDMFKYYIDFTAEYTEFPRRRLTDSFQSLTWESGYKDTSTGLRKGSQNAVIGITSNSDSSKLIGSRGVLYIIEEMGKFPGLRSMWDLIKPCVSDGKKVWGLIFAYGCVCAGTNVFDKDNNPIKIEDADSSILGYDGNGLSVENITYIQPEAYKECVRITTTNGSIECSTDHPLLALNKDNFHHNLGSCSFYKANELKIGDYLMMYGNDRFGNIRVDDAYLLGSLFGDGNYSTQSCVSLSVTTEEQYEYFDKNYDIGISKVHDSKDGLYAQIYFRNLHGLMKRHGMDGQAFREKKLPNTIWQWDRQSISEFLAGYFDADGNIQIVKKDYRTIKLSCKYKDVLEQVDMLLQKFNIFSYILKEEKPARVLHSNVNNKDYKIEKSELYVLYICNGCDIVRFRESIKLKIKFKQERLDTYNPGKRSVCYFDDIEFVYRESNHKGEYFKGKTLHNLKASKIKNIEYLGQQRIYNLTANTTHTYLSNGFISSNTAGEDESDFTSAKELLYNPLGYNIYAIKNVYDKQGLGRDKFAFFFPAYMNRAGCYNKDGISDVTKALIEILMERYVKKYNSSDINSITTLIAQNPITPQEAIMKVKDNFFPVTQINERINQLDSDTSSFDDVYVGDFAMDKDGKVTFVSTQQQPIREFPLDEKTPNKEGAVELYELPQKINGEVPSGRYIISVDPYDKDQADTTSLYSMFIFDLFTDRVVGEYTGRPSFVQTAYERTRLAALFYNARVGYENNIMGLFQYFTEKRCIHLLLETPEFLYDKQIIKIRGVGNAKYGIRATVPINNLGNDLIKQWLMQTTVVEREIEGQVQQIEIPNLYVLKNRALLQECAFYNPVINVDRIRSFGILMIYRQSMIIVYGGDVKSQYEQYDKDDPANDEFFIKNYHPKNAYYRKKDWD